MLREEVVTDHGSTKDEEESGSTDAEQAERTTKTTRDKNKHNDRRGETGMQSGDDQRRNRIK